MTGMCHEFTAAIDIAVDWLSETLATGYPDKLIIPTLENQFGLSTFEARQAIKEFRFKKFSFQEIHL